MTPFTPRPYQTIGAQYLIDHPRCMLVADPGLGKTGTMLLALDMLKMVGSNFFPALVLAPKRVCDVVWTGEQQKWSSFQDLSIIKVLGDSETRKHALRQSLADIYLCNYENAGWLTSLWSQSKWPFKIVIADESSKLKSFRLSRGGKRAAALADIARFTGRWHNLTGTPSPDGLWDLWGQYWFIDFGQRLKHSYTAFFEAYCMEHPYTRAKSLQSGAETAIHEAVKDVTIAFRAEDWLDITKPQELPVEFEMNPSAFARYSDMERHFWMEVDDKQIEAGTAAIKSFKLLQLCAGSVYDDQSMSHEVHDDRLQALDDVLEQIGHQQLLLSYFWKFDVPRVLRYCQKNGIKARVYDGQRAEDDWNDEKFQVMLLQEQSAHGLNLALHCRDIMHYSYVWNAEWWKQMIERVGPARQAQLGKKAAVRVWYPVARGTMESSVVMSNFRKISTEEAFKRARAQRYV